MVVAPQKRGRGDGPGRVSGFGQTVASTAAAFRPRPLRPLAFRSASAAILRRVAHALFAAAVRILGVRASHAFAARALSARFVMVVAPSWEGLAGMARFPHP